MPTVPSCRDCNSLLSDYLEPRISYRASFILDKLFKKHRKVLNQPVWLDHEIKELRGKMRDFVESRQATRHLLESRITFLELGGAINASPNLIQLFDF